MNTKRYYICVLLIVALSVFAMAQKSGSINGHKWVDLGLPSGTKWATCNIGASSPEGPGTHYAWGETKTKKSYTIENNTTFRKKILDISGNAEYDAATTNWGNSWRTPTKDEIEELIDYCSWNLTTLNGRYGYMISGNNGNSIFLPMNGYYVDNNPIQGVKTNAYYWTSTPTSLIKANALIFGFENKYTISAHRNYGYSIRAVVK